ncbi:MAG: SusC/RagA family TonB-linked outer membrane protein, partial [Longimicrobiaceae bacterium]
TLKMDGVPLEAALQEIARQAQLRLTYSRESLPERRVSAHAEQIRASEAFTLVLEGTGLEAVPMASGRVTIVRRGPAAPAAVDAARAPRPAAVEEPLPAAPAARVDVHLSVQAPRYAPAEVLAGTIHGRVTEAGSGRGLGGAQVAIAGSQRSAVTNAGGDYTLGAVPAGRHLLRVSVLGHQPGERAVEVVDGQVAEASFSLSTAAVQLDRLVVTGTAGATSRRTVGNAVSTIDAAEITDRVVNQNVSELLQAKAPGVSVLQSSGSPGAAGNIRIRGVGSLSGSSEPVVYVDGVRYQSNAGGAFRNNWQSPAQGQLAGGGQTASALDAINPQDIESIEVIKGPAAATLYGADAANGVIQIITRKGRPGSQPLRWDAKVQLGSTSWGLDRRASLTTCDAARIGDAAEWPGCAGKPQGTVLRETFLDDAVQSGGLRNLSTSVSGGGQGYSFYGAVDHNREEGVFPNSLDQRTGTRANFAFYPSQAVDFNVNVGYSRIRTAFPSTDNGPNVLEAAWTYQPGRAPQRGQTYGFAGGTPEQFARYDNQLRADRVTIGSTFNVRPWAWFRNRLTVGADINSQQANRYIAPGGVFSPTTGQMTQGAPRNNLYTFDWVGTAESGLPFTSLSSDLSVGVQYTSREFRNTVAQGTGFSTDLVNNIGSATDRFSWDEYLAVKSLGFFAQEQVGWRERLYLTGALRVDNSSIFGDNIDQLYYPKLSLAWTVSEEPFFHRFHWLDNLKVRAAWGEAGNAPDPFAKVTTYALVQHVDPATGNVVSGVRLLTMGNPDVKPERGSELEAGFDAALLHNRLGVELTFYDKTTHDALVSVPLPPSEAGIAGGSQFRNLGEINNRGVELSITGTPVETRVLTWESRLNLATNRNQLVDFGFDTGPILLGVTTLNQRHAEGFPLAGYWVHDPVFDPAQNKYVPSEARYLGPSMPTREASLSTNLTLLRNLQLFTLFDYKGGNYLLNMTDWRRCRAELCEQVNAAGVSAERRAMLEADLSANDALYTQRADFIKFRDVSLTWTLPQRASRRFGADRASISLAAHNLGFVWKPYYTGLDPEVTFNGINQPGEDGQAFGWTRMDYWTVPMTRRLTAAINLSF